MQPLIRHNDIIVDELEAMMFEAAMNKDSDVEFVDCKVNDYFFPKLYVREILMPAHKLITSEVHKTCHLFEIIQGAVSVNIDGKGWVTYTAFHEGTTEANTRRILFTWENTVWRTYHVLDFLTGEENDLPKEEKAKVVQKIKDTIIEPYVNELLGGHVFLNNIDSQLINNQ